MWVDSEAVVYEQKGTYSFGLNDSIVLKGYDVYKYTFFDLITRRCQDYLSFTDTATVIANYIVPKDSVPGINFRQEMSRSLDSMKILADTVVDGKLYKRIRYTVTWPEITSPYEETYYLLPGALHWPKNIIYKKLQTLIPGGIVERVDMHQLPPIEMRATNTIHCERNYLTPEEETVFKKWQQNALETKVPVTPAAEVLSRFWPPIKYRNHPLVTHQTEGTPFE